jgi:hypothetical protein
MRAGSQRHRLGFLPLEPWILMLIASGIHSEASSLFAWEESLSGGDPNFYEGGRSVGRLTLEST